MYDLAHFDMGAMTACSQQMRILGQSAASMEQAAVRMVDHLYEGLRDGKGGPRAASLVRFFKTHEYGRLEPELKEFASSLLPDADIEDTTRCLTLLATAGDEAAWKTRARSRGHKAIPLLSEEAVMRIPMISQLIRQLGISVSSVVEPDQTSLRDVAEKTFNVFYVREALGSPYFPAQEEFVRPYGIRSVIGFGGVLPSGSVFTMILFLKIAVTEEIADLFMPIALSVKLGIFPHDGERTFSGSHDAAEPVDR